MITSIGRSLVVAAVVAVTVAGAPWPACACAALFGLSVMSDVALDTIKWATAQLLWIAVRVVRVALPVVY